MERESNARRQDSIVQCLELQTSPVRCFILMDDVLEILQNSGEYTSAVHLTDLGLAEQTQHTLSGERLIRFRSPPLGPPLALSSEITSASIDRTHLLPLPEKVFPNSLYSDLVLIDGRPAGLLLQVARYLELHAESRSVMNL